MATPVAKSCDTGGGEGHAEAGVTGDGAFAGEIGHGVPSLWVGQRLAGAARLGDYHVGFRYGVRVGGNASGRLRCVRFDIMFAGRETLGLCGSRQNWCARHLIRK
jgi:hypothetical protein